MNDDNTHATESQDSTRPLAIRPSNVSLTELLHIAIVSQGSNLSNILAHIDYLRHDSRLDIVSSEFKESREGVMFHMSLEYTKRLLDSMRRDSEGEDGIIKSSPNWTRRKQSHVDRALAADATLAKLIDDGVLDADVVWGTVGRDTHLVRQISKIDEIDADVQAGATEKERGDHIEKYYSEKVKDSLTGWWIPGDDDQVREARNAPTILSSFGRTDLGERPMTGV